MFNNLGIEWAATLLGCLAAVMVPIPVLFYLYGAKIRRKSTFAPSLDLKMPPPVEDEVSVTSAEEGNGGPRKAEKEKTKA